MDSILLNVLLICTFWADQTSQTINLKENSTLRLVHVIFRHGNRTPDRPSLYPNDPHYDESNYKEGYGQLTIKGKTKLYEVGLELRKRYDKFLTDTWNYKYLSVRSSEHARSIMSLELVLAALYPPKGDQKWSSIKWQPIPYEYVPLELDKEIVPIIACGKRLFEMYFELYDIPEISKYMMKYKALENIIETNTNINNKIKQIILYYGFKIQEELGLQIAPWATAIYPEPLMSAFIDTFYLLTNTTALRRITAGYLLKKILDDTAEKINGTIEPSERKMFFYSGHDFTIFFMLLSLNALNIDTSVPCGSYVLFEIHEIDGVHGIQLFYQFYEKDEPIPIKLPGCNYFCPFDQFYELVEYILPESDDECYGP